MSIDPWCVVVCHAGASSGGSSLTTTPTPAGSSYSPGPVEASNPIQQQQQLYLHLQAPRVVQQHSGAAEGSMHGQNAVHNATSGQSNEADLHGSLELTPATGPLDNIRSHSQLLLAQQRSQQHMQQMVRKKETGHSFSSSSWDDAGGFKGVLSSLAGL